MKETLIDMLAMVTLGCFTLFLLLGILILLFFLYDYWKYDLKFVVKEYVFRKLNKRKTGGGK